MGLSLEIISGPDAGKRLLLEAGDVRRVGRGKDADLQITGDSLVSRAHFAVDCSESRPRVRDLKSSNGTFLNGREVSEAAIADGDEIAVGKTRLRVRVDERTSPHPRRPAEPDPLPVQRPQGERNGVGPREDADRGRGSMAPVSETLDRETPGEEGRRATAPRAPFPSPRRDHDTPVAPAGADTSRPYSAALSDEDYAVRREALLAAAWAGRPWVLEHCSKLARRPSPEHWDALHLLAILAPPSYLPTFLAAAASDALGPRRFELLGTFGHPGAVPALLDAIASQDPLAAATAGAAFTKLTGLDLEPGPPATVATGEPGADAAADTPEEIAVPDPERARALWNRVKADFATGTRWRRGVDLSKGCSNETLSQLDMESRWDACLRGSFEGTWLGNLVDLEKT